MKILLFMSILFGYCIIPFTKKTFYINFDTIEIFLFLTLRIMKLLFLWVREEEGIIIYTKNLCFTEKKYSRVLDFSVKICRL